MMNFLTNIANWANEHPNQAIGAFLGFLAGLLILIFGFLKTCLVVILALIGFFIGKMKDDGLSGGFNFKDIFKRNKE